MEPAVKSEVTAGAFIAGAAASDVLGEDANAADDEDDFGSTQRPSIKKNQLHNNIYGSPNKTTKRATRIMNKYIKEEFLRLLSIPESVNDWNAYIPPPLSKDQYIAWASNSEGCIVITIDNFRYDFAHAMNSSFNAEAVQMFAKHLSSRLTTGPDRAELLTRSVPMELASEESIRRLLITQIRYLKFKYNGVSRNEVAKRKANRRSRKQINFKRRKDIADTPEFIAHKALISQLGTQGVSSDETDTENVKFPDLPGFRKIRVLRTIEPSWRSDALGGLCAAMDRAARDRADIRRSQRIRLGHKSERIAPPGLPRNCYNSEWVKTLSTYDLGRINTQEFDYDFSFINGPGSSSNTISDPIIYRVSSM